MTTTPPDPTEAASAAVPPPGCPAHGLSPDGLAKLYGPEYESDAMGLFERLRKEHGAVAPVLVEGDLQAWLVLGYRENLHVARSSTPFSRDSRLWADMSEGRVPDDSRLKPMLSWAPLCIFTDGEEHERLRVAIAESMARFDRRGVRRHVTRFANQLIDEFAGDGEAELVTQFAEHLPMLVMTRLLGMPDEYGPRLVDASRDLFKGAETALESNAYVMQIVQQLVAKKRATPGSDLASWLMEHHAELTDDEVLQHLRVILIGAHESTTNLIANTLRVMLTDRRFRASLAGGQMTLPDAVEQVLWDEPPFVAMPARWTANDTEVAGQPIKAGDMMVLGFAAGNTDPVIRPDLAEPMHGNRSHLAFSAGVHECPGQDIARAIADTSIDILLSRLPGMRMAVDEGDLTWVSSVWTRRLTALPVEFTPSRVAPAPSTAGATGGAQTPAAGLRPSAGNGRMAPAGGQAPDPVTAPEGRGPWWKSLTRWLRGR